MDSTYDKIYYKKKKKNNRQTKNKNRRHNMSQLLTYYDDNDILVETIKRRIIMNAEKITAYPTTEMAPEAPMIVFTSFNINESKVRVWGEKELPSYISY